MRREVFGLGSAAGMRYHGGGGAHRARCSDFPGRRASCVGGAVAMSSTVLIVQQLAERAELNRTHGRLAFSVVLFQDIAVVPFLALAAALAPGSGGVQRG